MKRLSNSRNKSDTDRASDQARSVFLGAGIGAFAGCIAMVLVAGTLGAASSPAEAQVRSQAGVDDGAAAERQGARQRMDSFRDRMRRGHQRGQQRALDTNERVRRDRERQIQRLDDLRRQRSR